MPFMRREFYRESTASPFEAFGVPVVTLAGLCFAGFSAYLMWRYLRFEPLIETQSLGTSILMLGLVLAASSAVCFAFYLYRRGHESASVEIFVRDAGGRPPEVETR
jgi:hypothetical protein